jgi:molybdate transport system ATP-binding protein
MIRFDCRVRRGDFALDAAFTATTGITALFGPSGSGKSTILRLMAGLLQPDEGTISFDDTVLSDRSKRVFIPPHKRRFGYVLQDSLLFPHLSVRRNLAYGEGFTPPPERRLTLAAVTDVLGIAHLLDRRTEALSGGERQRVAIGRALLASPRLLLLDEPLASLDRARKDEILPFIERLRDEFRLTMLYVSHAEDEVRRLAGTVIRIDQGRILSSA